VSRLTKLTAAQFQFVRALYIAIPPVSRQLPPGDSAVIASADGKAMIALVTQGGVACARFLAPDFILTMLAQVARGETGSSGQPI
jgi:DNA-binding transcriptional regulator YdaS (Cro superfamily)